MSQLCIFLIAIERVSWFRLIISH